MQILSESFENLDSSKEAELRAYFDGYEYNSSGYTFLANYIWRTGYKMYYEVINGYLFLGAENPYRKKAHQFFSMPLTKTGSYDGSLLKKSILEVRKRCLDEGIEFCLDVIPHHMRNFIEEAFFDSESEDGIRISWEEDRDSADYVYLKDKLISLSGRALHKKKNHMNYFLKNISYKTEKLSKVYIDKVMEFVVQFKKDKSKEEQVSLSLEADAIEQILQDIDSPEVYSVGLFVGDELVGFAIGELLSDTVAVEHFEKADDSYRGIYQVLCSEFCKALPESVTFVNREEDMGLENLRQAKEALRPDHMEEKYSCYFEKM